MEKPLQNVMMNYSIHKFRFLDFIAAVFENFRTFFMQLTLYPKHSRSESLPLLPPLRDPMESQPSPRNSKILNIGDCYLIAALNGAAQKRGWGLGRMREGQKVVTSEKGEILKTWCRLCSIQKGLLNSGSLSQLCNWSLC